MNMTNKLFKKFIKLYKLTKNLTDQELDTVFGEIFIFRGNTSEESAEPDDIELIEKNLKKKEITHAIIGL